MAAETILQHDLFAKFVFPFLLIFLIVFAILEKTKVLGENKQISALVAFVIGLIFVGFTYPKDVATNMVLFLAVAVVVAFVGLLIWGFVWGEGIGVKDSAGWVKYVVGGIFVIAMVGAVLWSTGSTSNVFDLLFDSSWSAGFWRNVVFIAVIVGVLAAVMVKKK